MKAPGVVEVKRDGGVVAPSPQTMDLGSCGESSRDESHLQELCSPRTSRFRHRSTSDMVLQNHPPHPTTHTALHQPPRARAHGGRPRHPPPPLHAEASAPCCTSCPLFCPGAPHHGVASPHWRKCARRTKSTALALVAVTARPTPPARRVVSADCACQLPPGGRARRSRMPLVQPAAHGSGFAGAPHPLGSAPTRTGFTHIRYPDSLRTSTAISAPARPPAK